MHISDSLMILISAGMIYLAVVRRKTMQRRMFLAQVVVFGVTLVIAAAKVVAHV